MCQHQRGKLRSLHAWYANVRSFEHLNDPREAKTWPFKFYARTDGPFDRELFQRATEFVTKRSLITCCSRNAPTVSHGESLRPGYAHPRMWAQYADNHGGVCLAFDSAELDACVRDASGDRQVFSGSVEYHDTHHGPPTGAVDPYGIAYLEDVMRGGLAAIMELFFRKHIDWRDEWECRWVVRSTDDTPLFVPMMRALRGVLIGHDCSPPVLEHIVSVCSRHAIPVHRIYWHGWTFSTFGDLLESGGTEGISLNSSSNGVSGP